MFCPSPHFPAIRFYFKVLWATFVDCCCCTFENSRICFLMKMSLSNMYHSKSALWYGYISWKLPESWLNLKKFRPNSVLQKSISPVESWKARRIRIRIECVSVALISWIRRGNICLSPNNKQHTTTVPFFSSKHSTPILPPELLCPSNYGGNTRKTRPV